MLQHLLFTHTKIFLSNFIIEKLTVIDPCIYIFLSTGKLELFFGSQKKERYIRINEENELYIAIS